MIIRDGTIVNNIVVNVCVQSLNTIGCEIEKF